MTIWSVQLNLEMASLDTNSYMGRNRRSATQARHHNTDEKLDTTMTLMLHDTLAREKRAFVPGNPKRVTLYVCGPTVYNYAHVGNARPVVVFDVLYRLLRAIYGQDAVVYARNFTDVDDRINQKAAEEGVEIGVVTERYISAYQADMDAVFALRPDLEPRATAHMGDIINLVQTLLDKGAAYLAEGHVLFDTQAYDAYGQLSGRNLEDMIAGARVEVAPYKRHGADFVLWKPSKPGEPVWESPFGPGRPGWHIECSAMVEAALGSPIDIHGGGHDLIFPHHENEIAQSVCAKAGHGHDRPVYARYWLHNGFLTMDSEKMSKSLGNVLLVHDLVKQVPGEAVRWALLAGHYRAPLDWTDKLIDQSVKALDRLYGVLQRAKSVVALAPSNDDVFAPLMDDLNTPQAFSQLFALADELDQALREGNDEAGRYKGQLLHLAGVLGFLQADPDVWFMGGADADLAAKIEGLLQTRLEARASKDFAAADRIRDELNALNVVVMDGPEGATWRLRETR